MPLYAVLLRDQVPLCCALLRLHRLMAVGGCLVQMSLVQFSVVMAAVAKLQRVLAFRMMLKGALVHVHDRS